MTLPRHRPSLSLPARLGAELRRPAVGKVLIEAGVFGLFVVAAMYATWPLTAHLATRVPENLGDPLENAWIFAWGAHAIGPNPFAHHPLHVFDANMFWPERHTLAYAENMLGLSVFVAPVFWLTHNPVLTTNVAILVLYALTGFGVYYLVRELSGSRWAAVLAGVAYAVGPYRLAQIDHPHVLATHLTPFVLVVLLRLGKDVTRRRVIALGILVALQLWGSLTGALLTFTAAGAWAVWELLRSRRHALGSIRAAGAGIGIGIVLAVPVLLPYLAVRRAHPEYQHPVSEAIGQSATPGSYLLTPDQAGPVVDAAYDGISEPVRQGPAGEKPLFPGFWLTAAFLAALAVAAAVVVPLVSRRPGERQVDPRLAPVGLALLIGLAGFVLSLGPRLGARPGGPPLPFALVSRLAPGSLSRVPARFGALVLLAMAMVAGLALARLRGRAATAVLVASAVVLVLEAMPASVVMAEPPAITAGHRSLENLAGPLLVLPTTEFDDHGGLILGSLIRESQHLYLSTAHFRPLVNGYGGYVPPLYWSLVRAVQDFPSTASVAALRERRIRTVVVETSLVPGTRWHDVAARLDAWPGARLVRAGDGLRVYDVG